MFRYTDYNRKAFTAKIVPPGPVPEDWITTGDIDRRYYSIWEEHCLECAAPACYDTCGHYIRRKDGRCQRTRYGTRDRKDLRCDTARPSQLKFRKWGKMETEFHPFSLPAAAYRKLEDRCAALETVFSMPEGPIRRRLLRRFNKCLLRLCSRGAESQPGSFVLQCYSPDPEPFSLFLEIFGRNRHAIIRHAFPVRQGYNQFILPLSDTVLDVEEKMWVRLFPENDREAELVFYLCGFVDLKQKNTVSEPAPKVKCVAWDLDGTVWDKTLIESDPGELILREGVRQTILDLDARGILQVVVSKNYEQDVLPVLRRLGLEDYFVHIAANWQPKSQNLATVASLLNIHIDSFALIDDSAFERGEVTENLGRIRVYPETAVPGLLSRPEFDVPVTAEAANRRIMYRQEARRKISERGFSSISAFLKDCRIEVVARRIGEDSFERSFELLQRTNQLNLSGRRYRREELKEICDRDPENIFVLSCSDRYGDYGQIGFLRARFQEGTLTVDEYALSCRVAGKMLEPSIFSWLMDRYQAGRLVLSGVNNHRNRLLIETLWSLGFVNEAADGLLAMTITREKADWEKVVSLIDRTAL